MKDLTWEPAREVTIERVIVYDPRTGERVYDGPPEELPAGIRIPDLTDPVG